MTREEQEQAFNRRVKQNESGAVGEAALSADEQTNGQTHKPSISDATNAIVEKTDEAAVRNVKQPATQSALVDAGTQQASKENAIDKLLQSRIQANEAEQQKLEADYQAQQKRQKRNAIISSIADGLSALSNMYFTSKGAPTPTRQAASMSEQQAKQNVADRNTYLELLQGWRKRNNELLNNYVTYQATAEKNRIANDNLQLSIDREARLYAKDEAERAYKEEMIRQKQQGLDDAKAAKAAELAYKYAYLDALTNYRNRSLNIAQQRANNAAAGSTTTTSYTYNQGKLADKTVTKTNQ